MSLFNRPSAQEIAVEVVRLLLANGAVMVVKRQPSQAYSDRGAAARYAQTHSRIDEPPTEHEKIEARARSKVRHSHMEMQAKLNREYTRGRRPKRKMCEGDL